MPQKDRYKSRFIPIEYKFFDCILEVPQKDRCTIVLVTYGSVTLKINGHIRLITSPCALCLSQYDTVEVIHRDKLSAKTFHFDPWFIKADLCFENLDDEIEIDSRYEYDRKKLYMFTQHDNVFQGAISLPPIYYMRVNELMLMIGAETYAQSDGFWTCRIRRMLLQVINTLFDVYVDQCKLKMFDEPVTLNPASLCAEYIHNNYSKDITLNDLCALVNLNRTSLNTKFKAQFSCTCMEYLLNYRLKISQELLSNTNMKISEIAENCGFKYDSYFNRQFTRKLGISPATYRKNPLSYTAFESGPIRTF
ncbi:MAG: helix-turn-helix transcriptional regulator [Lachnospira sp.]|nr:helix-turn-helix transcriptional regulator [Lachnospira sp.]